MTIHLYCIYDIIFAVIGILAIILLKVVTVIRVTEGGRYERGNE